MEYYSESSRKSITEDDYNKRTGGKVKSILDDRRSINKLTYTPPQASENHFQAFY